MSDNKPSVIARAREIIDSYQGDQIRIMEVCGTHTHEIFRLGIRQILPDKVRLISGPGCPVCVTPVDFIDEAVYLAMEKDVTICTFGDLVRVPGSFGTAGTAAGSAEKKSAVSEDADNNPAKKKSAVSEDADNNPAEKKSAVSGDADNNPAEKKSAVSGDAGNITAEKKAAGDENRKTARTAKIGSLAAARAAGARIQVVYAPQDAVAYAREHPEEQVVFLSVGFETTTPSSCLAVKEAQSEGLNNFSILTANKTMPSAYEAMKDSTDAFLYPGHVHAITGTGICEEMAEKGASGVVAGFTAKELMTALAVIVKKTQEGKPFFENCYPRVVRAEGSPAAQRLVEEMMEPCDARWRGIGVLPASGVKLRPEYAAYDARVKFDIPSMEGRENPACRCGEVLQGKCLPSDCKVFGKGCTPEHPIGACMVSGEGACSAFYLYGGDR
jgi:hydrogenase expression/formation protein HypD